MGDWIHRGSLLTLLRLYQAEQHELSCDDRDDAYTATCLTINTVSSVPGRRAAAPAGDPQFGLINDVVPPDRVEDGDE